MAQLGNRGTRSNRIISDQLARYAVTLGAAGIGVRGRGRVQWPIPGGAGGLSPPRGLL